MFSDREATSIQDHLERHRHDGRRFSEGLLADGRILEALAIQPGQTVVDAGCGNGYMARAISARLLGSGKVLAVDRDPHNLEIVRRGIEGTVIEAIEGDITALPMIAASSVDTVYVSTVLHALSDDQKARFLSEARRILKPNGLLAIVEVEKEEIPFGPPMHRKLSPGELKQRVPMDPAETLTVGTHFYLQTFRKTNWKTTEILGQKEME